MGSTYRTVKLLKNHLYPTYLIGKLVMSQT